MIFASFAHNFCFMSCNLMVHVLARVSSHVRNMLSSRIESLGILQGHDTRPLSHNIMVEGDSKILINSIKRAYCIPWRIKILVQVNINSVLAKNLFLFAEGCF